MIYDVYISEQADADLRGLFEYIVFRLLSPEDATRQIDRLEAAIHSLAEYPERFAQYRREPWLSRGLRMMPVDNYCVFYIPDKRRMTVTVIRVLYAGRDIDRILRSDAES